MSSITALFGINISGSRNTVNGNYLIGNGNSGIFVPENAAGNIVFGNTANFFGGYGFEDQSIGSKTAMKANRNFFILNEFFSCI